MSTAKPFLKWVGGKTQLLPTLLPLIQSQLTPKSAYHEPFVGGGAVSFGLKANGFNGPMYLSDANADLVNAYACVAGSVELLIEKLLHLSEKNSEAFYYEVRAFSNPLATIGSHWDAPFWRAARFIYLNKTCFNGLTRYNRKGEFNVPWGKYKSPTICDGENLRACSAALERATVECQDFTVVLQNARAGDVAYLDPPYVPVSKTSSFTGYSKDGFTTLDQAKLEDACRKLDRLGAKFVLSNSDCEETRGLYHKWNVQGVQARRNVNSVGSKRGAVGEIVVTNF